MATDTAELPPLTIDLTGLPKQVVERVNAIVREARQLLAAQATRPPLIGRFAHLGLSFPKDELDAAQREAWADFPRDFPNTPAT